MNGRSTPPPEGTRWLVRFDRASIANIPPHCAKGRHLYMREGGGITGLRRKARRFKSPERARAAASGVRPGITWCVVRLLPRSAAAIRRHQTLGDDLTKAKADLAALRVELDRTKTDLESVRIQLSEKSALVDRLKDAEPDRVDVKGIVSRLEGEHEAKIAKMAAAHAAELERCMSERPPATAVARELARCLELVQDRALWHGSAKTALLSVAGHLRRGLRIEEAIDATVRVVQAPPVKVPT